MSTIKKSLHAKSAKKAASLFSSIRNGQHTVTTLDTEDIAEYIGSCGPRNELQPILWQIAAYGPENNNLKKMAIKLLSEITDLSAEEVAARALPQVLMYLLRKSSSEDKEDIIQRFSGKAPNHLKFSVVEHLLSLGRVREAISLMIDMLPDLDTDHDITDAICIYFTEYFTPEQVMYFKQEEQIARDSGNNEKAEDIAWALSFARNAPP